MTDFWWRLSIGILFGWLKTILDYVEQRKSSAENAEFASLIRQEPLT